MPLGADIFGGQVAADGQRVYESARHLLAAIVHADVFHMFAP